MPRSQQGAPSPQRHRRTASAAHYRGAAQPLSPRISASVEGTVVTVVDALRGHAGAALIAGLCVLLSLTVRAAGRSCWCMRHTS